MHDTPSSPGPDLCAESSIPAGDARVTRLAPSPTGSLHLGNAWTFLINWALARRGGWRVILRIEDLDTPRVKAGVVEETVRTLEWLGLTWDERVADQSSDLSGYAGAMDRLASRGRVYPSSLTRREIAEAVGAPQEGDAESRFPPELRPASVPDRFEDGGMNWRLLVEPGGIGFEDRCAGARSFDPSVSVGDFVVWTQRGCPSYQLAVTVDDHRQGVTDVVRGNDLLDSTARQLLLRRLLGYGGGMEWYHVPLVRGPDGRRLAKRHGDTRLTSYRVRGVAPERVIGLLAGWCGVDREPMGAEDFALAFDLGTMAAEDVIMTPEDDAWLLG